ncbi:MAG: class I SAM-dependent methyltransferase [Burkholderiaceae bacterium]|nr:class I SAM-dependent methyltransferase [Burkholderiaceae bacterium]
MNAVLKSAPEELAPPTLGYPVQENFEATSYQAFIRSIRNFWRSAPYADAVREASALDGEPRDLETQMCGRPGYALYAWLERRSQQFKYQGRWGLLPTLRARQRELEEALATAARISPDLLILNTGFQPPDYVTAVDTHQHAGGLWRGATDGFAYEAASQGASFSMLSHDVPVKRIVEAAAVLLGAGKISRLVEVGCTAGPVARALKHSFPQAEVIGCDVSAPVLRLAHLRSVQQGVKVKWVQACAERLPLETGSVDLLCSNYLVHEMPPAALRESFVEARRVLRVGGALVIQDMYLIPGGAVGTWLQAGYAARNNEPFAYPLLQLDLTKELELAGFDEVSVRYSYPEPEADGSLPAFRTHYVTLITAKARD